MLSPKIKNIPCTRSASGIAQKSRNRRVPLRWLGANFHFSAPSQTCTAGTVHLHFANRKRTDVWHRSFSLRGALSRDPGIACLVDNVQPKVA
jgi:hypothetical protein